MGGTQDQVVLFREGKFFGFAVHFGSRGNHYLFLFLLGQFQNDFSAFDIGFDGANRAFNDQSDSQRRPQGERSHHSDPPVPPSRERS